MVKKTTVRSILVKPALRGLKISAFRGEKGGLRLHGGRDEPKRRLVNSCVCSVRPGRREALTRRANTKKKTRRRRWKRCRTKRSGKGEGEEAERGRRKGEEPGKARRRLFKVRCKLCRPSAASIGRLFVQPPTQSTSFHLIKTPDPAGTQQPDSLTILSLSFFLFLSFFRPLFDIFLLSILSVLLSTMFLPLYESLSLRARRHCAPISNRSYPEMSHSRWKPKISRASYQNLQREWKRKSIHFDSKRVAIGRYHFLFINK